MREERDHIRYLGFEVGDDGGRRLQYTITSVGRPARRAMIAVPSAAFMGPQRISFQDASVVGYERLRFELLGNTREEANYSITLTAEDIERFRPRRRAATKRP